LLIKHDSIKLLQKAQVVAIIVELPSANAVESLIIGENAVARIAQLIIVDALFVAVAQGILRRQKRILAA
jgi:DNA-binding MurR/RpiR family transcriptional regulator